MTNFGQILGGTGFYIYSGTPANTTTNIQNRAGGTISGSVMGVYFPFAGGTVTNAGTISGGGGTAVKFKAGGGRVVVQPGAIFSGSVIAPGTATTNVFELASAASTGTIGGLGSTITGFGTTAVDAGASWAISGAATIAATTLAAGGVLQAATGSSLRVTGSVTGTGTVALCGGTVTLNDGIAATATLALGGGVVDKLIFTSPDGNIAAAITGFGFNDQIEAPVTFDGATLNGQSLALTNAGTTVLTLSSVAFDTGVGTPVFTIGTDGANHFVSVACFREGTRIRTTKGDVAVERLRAGDLIPTAIGRTAVPVVWVGHRTVDCLRHPEPEQVLPVRVAAGTFGPGAPTRDLYLSPNHAIYTRGVLVPVKYLIDGGSIRQVSAGTVTYYHIELAEHDVLLAEGLPAESYLDDGDRDKFTTGGTTVRLHPDFATRRWEATGCAPLVLTGPILAAVRDAVRRSSASGSMVRTRPRAVTS